MLVTIKKQTQPDVVSANLVLYSKEENDKMLNDPELKDISLKFRGSSNQRIIDMNKTRELGEIALLYN